MKRKTTVTVGLLVAVAVLFLCSVSAQTSEQPESSVSPIPSSQSPLETEVPPEQRFIELSRTKKLSHRRRPPPRQFRTSSTPPPETQPQSAIPPAEASSQSQPLTSEDVPAVISTRQPTVTTVEPKPNTPTERRPEVTNKVRFTKTRAAKSNRGQVFTFTFKKHEDNVVKEKQHAQSRVPARFSSVFTNETPKRREGITEASSETYQPDNAAINSGPPVDVPRLRQSGRVPNLSDTSSQRNQISQTQDSEAKTTPEYIGESPIPDKFLPSFKPKSKTRLQNEQLNALPDVARTPEVPTQPVRELHEVNEGQNLARDSSSLPLKRKRPLKEGFRTPLPNGSGVIDNLPTPSRETEDPSLRSQNVNEAPRISNSPVSQTPRVRYVKAGSLRFLPNPPASPNNQPESARLFANPTVQTVNERQDPSELGNYPTPRPDPQSRPLRPESVGFLQEFPTSPKDVAPEEIRNYVDPTPQTSTLREQGPPERDFTQAFRQPNQESLLKQESARVVPNDPQAIPPELARDFANLQTLIGNRDPARFSSHALQRPNQRLNSESLRFLPQTSTSPHELSPELRKDFTNPSIQPLTVNEEQHQLPPGFFKQSIRPTKVKSLEILRDNAENLEGLQRQTLGDFARSTVQPLEVNPEQHRLQGRFQELQQTSRPLKEGLAIFVPIGTQRPLSQQFRDSADSNPEIPVIGEGQEPIRQEGQRSNRPFNAGPRRYLPNGPRVLHPQPTYDHEQSHIRQESSRSRFLPDDTLSPPPQSTRDFVDSNLRTLVENEEQIPRRQESLRGNRPLDADAVSRFLPRDPQGLPAQSQSINFAEPNIQNLIENERQGVTRLNSPTPTRLNRLQLGSERLLSNDKVFAGEQSSLPGLDKTDFNFRNTPPNERPVNERLPTPIPETPIRLQKVTAEPEINSFTNPADRPSSESTNTRENPVHLEANQQVTNNVEPTNPKPNVATPTESPHPPTTMQPKPQTAVSYPGFATNPPNNIPRLIIEFPSSPTSGDQSIRLQLNPNTVPAAPAVSPQPSIPPIPTEVPTSTTADYSSDQPKQQELQAINGAATRPPSPSITATADVPVQAQTNQQTSPSNSGQATNSQVNVQLPSRPVSSANTGDSTSFQLNQHTTKNAEIAVNPQSNTPRSPANLTTSHAADTTLREEPKTPPFQANGSSNKLGVPIHSLSTLPRTPYTSAQPQSQTLSSQSMLLINPLSQTLAFSSQLSPSQSTTNMNSTSLQANPLLLSSNAAQSFNSLSNPYPVQQLTAITSDSSVRSPLNQQILTNVGPKGNAVSNHPVPPSDIQVTPPTQARESPTRLEPISQRLSETESAGNTSLKSEGPITESKPLSTDYPSKSNVSEPNARLQAPPVDVRLTINFNSNIPGFPQPQENPTQKVGSNAGSSNNTQLNTPPSPQEHSLPIPPNTSNFLTRPEYKQFQPTTASPINSPTTSLGIPDNLLPPVTNSPLHSQSNFQVPGLLPPRENFQVPQDFRATSNPQFDVRGLSSVTQDSSIRTQPFSQFLNTNVAEPVNTQFNSYRSQLNLRPSQSPSLQDQLSRFNQINQFLSANAGSPVNSQFNIPGRPFEVLTQQSSTPDVLARYQSQSQFQNTDARYVNSQFNNFGALPSSSSLSLFTQAPTRLQPVPQVFTANTGLAVNSLSYSPGLSVELLPPLTGESLTSVKRSEELTTNEQPRVSFLVNSPQLSADLLPPVVSESISAQPSNFQTVQPTSPKPSITPFSLAGFDPSPQFVSPNIRPVLEPPIELLPPLDPFFPKYSQNPNVGLPPNPIDIPKPLVPALVPPPREKIAIPIDIPRPAVPALVPPPREREETPTPIDIPKPDVPALVPPPREHIETPIDIPKPDVPALVPPPRPSDLARFLPPAPTFFAFKPPDVSQQESIPNPERPFNLNIQANPQSQQIVQTSTDHPVLILPKSSSRQQGRFSNPLSIEDLSKTVGFVPQSLPAPFSLSSQFSSTQIKTDSDFQITDIRAGRLQPISQEVITSDTPSQLVAKANLASPQTALFRNAVSLGLQAPPLPTSGPSSQQLAFNSAFSNEQTKTIEGQSFIDQRLKSTTQTPTQTLLPPLGQEFALSITPPSALPPQSPFSQTSQAFGTTSSLASSAEPPTVNIVPPKPKVESPLTQAPQTKQILTQPPQEGFIIFQTPTITVTSQTNQLDPKINVTIITQGGTGHLKPNTTLTAEPERPANITVSPQSHLFISTTPMVSSSTLPELPSTLLPPLKERTTSLPIKNTQPSLGPGFVRNNFTSNPFAPPFSQSFPAQSNPSRIPDVGTATGASTACPKLDLQHKGHRAPQFSGHLILSPGFYPIDDPTPTRCDNKGVIDGKKFNWWQILLNNGGEPSTLSRSNESKDAKIPPLKNPCVRPFETEGVPVFYNTTKTDSRTYYREEIAYHRYPESKNTFLESRGLFVWAQAKASTDSTAYLVLYTRDDSGFWLQVQNVNCQFDKNAQRNLRCWSVPECFCDGGQKRCTESVPVLTRNFPVQTYRS